MQIVYRSLTLLLLLQSISLSQPPQERFDDWPLELRIKGRIVVAASLPADTRLTQVAGTEVGLKALHLLGDNTECDPLPKFLEVIADRMQTTSVTQLVADDSQTQVNQVELIVWRDSRRAEDIPTAEHARLESLFRKHIRSGGTLLAIGSQSELLGRFWFSMRDGQSRLSAGMNLIPDCILRLPPANQSEPLTPVDPKLGSTVSCVDIAVQHATGLVLDGRTVHVFGQGGATFTVSADAGLPMYQQTIVPARPRERPSTWKVDLTQWRRMAMERTLEPFPPAAIQIPKVADGTLVIVGGGGMPAGLMQRFVDLAGSAAAAKLVYVPCSEDEFVSARQSTIEQWKELGVTQTAVLHTKDRAQANEDQAFLEVLRDATGIWFGGGRQWNFSDSYYGTRAHGMMKQVLSRGGVIGGSSAGASIQASYLARATPIENFQIMAPGYERGGLGFIRGVAIDQHFSQRGRHKDMSQLVDRYPQLLGIGIDEATAIIVRKSTAEVVGQGKVHFYDRRQSVSPDQADYVALAAGQTYELDQRKITLSPTP